MNLDARAYRFARGHLVAADDCDNEWYVDTGEPFDDRRPCAHCNRQATRRQHDACIADLPGVVFACCGHGLCTDHTFTGDRQSYIGFKDGSTVSGPLARAYMRALGGSPPEPTRVVPYPDFDDEAAA
jgi:hypothetical protein